ncbi:MAG: pyridoxal phosphate-dependent aminotransferase [Candidatus Abyssobacteria bacterium SURF_5]|uniref:Pyridoxal phosphate-dependent aminotransferase n=1 Tax=Abyssobacteria bacterium (strain SURF_5) TaxID=2093360 RepID=A0A3A4NYY2_ABYX5|nr:MAG: pyridoxal phosphate-dependent aminotransferase [Candidatus Abyssubacteria bacterium SURF_5]
MALSERARCLKPSSTLAITAKAKAMRAEGINVIGFGAGEPDFDTPDHIKAAAIQAIKEGFTKYTDASGMPELKDAVAAKFRRDNGIDYERAEITIGCGAKQLIYNIFQVVCDPGDEVLIPSPFWVSYPEQVCLTGGIPSFVQTRNFKMTSDQFESAITPKSKLLVLNSPSNPTGAVYSRKELEAIGEVALRHRILILSDECYERILYDGNEHHSIASFDKGLKDLTFTVNAVSKTYSMTGWRIGYAGGPASYIKAIGNMTSQSTSNPCSISQKASIAALTGDYALVEVMLKEFDKRRRILSEGLNELLQDDTPPPAGAFYYFPSISFFVDRKLRGITIRTADDFCKVLLDVARVAAVPGTDFGDSTRVRFSFATSEKNIGEGLSRISDCVREA